MHRVTVDERTQEQLDALPAYALEVWRELRITLEVAPSNGRPLLAENPQGLRNFVFGPHGEGLVYYVVVEHAQDFRDFALARLFPFSMALTNSSLVMLERRGIGVPFADRHLLLEWTNRVIGYQDPEHTDLARDAQGRPINPRSPSMLVDMFGYARELAERKRADPGPDVMTSLVQAEVDGQALDDAELQMFFFLLVTAGNDTVRSALPGGVLALLDHPAQYRRLRADLPLVPTAVEEMLRWHPPVLTFRRTAAADTVLAGQQIRRGDKVVVYHASAHYDERVFPDPFRFDITRNPNEHLAFGQGPHLRLGAHFARLQMRIFFTEFLTRLPRSSRMARPPASLRTSSTD